MIRYSMLFVAMVATAFRLNGQQVYQFSQYLQNLYILNTAAAGMNDYLEANLSYRKQWVGINNSPSTYYVSANMPVGKRLQVNPKSSSVRISSPTSYNSITRKSFHAFGGYIARDTYGPYGTNLGGLSYAFHLPVAKHTTISFSPNIGFSSVTFDASRAQVEVAGDPTYDNYLGTRNQSTYMDINVAFWLYHTKYFAGYSTDQLTQDRLKLSSQITLEKIRTHHNIIAGYHHPLSTDFVLTPSILVKYVNQAPMSFDFNVRMDYQDRYWAALSYRNSNTLVGMAGLYLNNTLRLGYAFDFTFSSLQLQNIGSHEIMLGLNLFNKEKVIF